MVNETIVNKEKQGKKILVIVGMQNDFVTGVLGNEMTKAIVPTIVKKLKTKYLDYDVIYLIRDIHFENYPETLEGKKIPPHCLADTDGKNVVSEIWETVKEIRSKGKYVKIIDKHTLASKKLIDYISVICGNSGEVEICGVHTDIDIASNAIALRAESPNVIIKIDSLCCAGTSMKAHNAALRTMNNCNIEIVGRKYNKRNSKEKHLTVE